MIKPQIALTENPFSIYFFIEPAKKLIINHYLQVIEYHEKQIKGKILYFLTLSDAKYKLNSFVTEKNEEISLYDIVNLKEILKIGNNSSFFIGAYSIYANFKGILGLPVDFKNCKENIY